MNGAPQAMLRCIEETDRTARHLWSAQRAERTALQSLEKASVRPPGPRPEVASELELEINCSDVATCCANGGG